MRDKRLRCVLACCSLASRFWHLASGISLLASRFWHRESSARMLRGTSIVLLPRFPVGALYVSNTLLFTASDVAMSGNKVRCKPYYTKTGLLSVIFAVCVPYDEES